MAARPGGPAGGGTFPSQPGRNPACEQSDVFFDSFAASNGGSGGSARNITPSRSLLAPLTTNRAELGTQETPPEGGLSR
jgi:hypothetical protein